MLRDTLKVLLVEDRSEDAELLIREMRARLSQRLVGGDYGIVLVAHSRWNG